MKNITSDQSGSVFRATEGSTNIHSATQEQDSLPALKKNTKMRLAFPAEGSKKKKVVAAPL